MKKSSYKKSGSGTATMKKNVGIVLLVAAMLLIAGAITTAVLLTQEKPPIDTPIVTPPVTYATPVESYSNVEESNLAELVYSSTLKKWITHNGVDFFCDEGTTVSSIQDGKVKSIQTSNLYGTVITIEHADGVTSRYVSLDSEVLVEVGMTVTKGQPIGKVGESLFEVAEGAHLHLEILQNGVLKNPADYLDDISGK